ncbi:MAG: hypothetical protein Q7S87_03485 [Agitococcus sp.]|nr:hypothetical protein [Agitococcus sp.]
MTQTTQSQIEAVRSFCEGLPNSVVKEAHVNDWGRFGNFEVFIVPKAATRHTTRQLAALVKKMLPKGAQLRACFPPDPVITKDFEGRTKVTGYARPYWALDIDYQIYDAESNRFSATA